MLSGQEDLQRQPRAESGTDPLIEMSQSPKSEKGLRKSVSILGHPVVVGVHYNCGAATPTALRLHYWVHFQVKAHAKIQRCFVSEKISKVT